MYFDHPLEKNSPLLHSGKNCTSLGSPKKILVPPPGKNDSFLICRAVVTTDTWLSDCRTPQVHLRKIPPFYTVEKTAPPLDHPKKFWSPLPVKMIAFLFVELLSQLTLGCQTVGPPRSLIFTVAIFIYVIKVEQNCNVHVSLKTEVSHP